MKRCVIFFVLFCLFTNLLHAQKFYPSYFKDAYNKGFITKTKDSLYYQRLLFEALPSDFKSFDNLYGWDEVAHVGRPLTATGPHYFPNIFYSKAYSRAKMLKKIIRISVNGELREGAIGRFQQDCFQLALAHNAQFVRVLQAFSKKDIISVWKFYFDQPNEGYRKKVYREIVAITQKNDEAMVAEIKIAYKKANAKWADKH
ncbi:hypothetical protein [Mucilaginibacter sp. dw_454]|uniref:hypothetical protein n=1 Tax=Mucilaginibacter sp. dw_454 TaxID=2720079 RepID=UPI001BD48F60|nr:hypothetical protein [Mucilaginibacter sp. dw_454]